MRKNCPPDQNSVNIRFTMRLIDDTRDHHDKFQQFFKDLRVAFKVCLIKIQW
jgi:hypothetical protein